ncbi:hypothetical protein F885_00592 [Acinetobacter higginsii]|uniref:Uncharacterized protein n=3 Tax=Acinetobacter TaxID=469 RepID=R9AVX1_9GAMM|nr:hypothetical protein F904_02838 [Acinetobacter dispersus]ENX55303.1 hypothetical protein F902_03373 [Acinetobacter higginsii]ENX63848.1 hypothetical protein F885_00592 [Acinetobacter higginsii]EOR06323.1 hypothetical protein F896_02783 [Acinetobacter genomosp. 15BJ]
MFNRTKRVKEYRLDIRFYESETARTGCHKNTVGVTVYE